MSDRFERRLSEQMGKDVRVVFTDNRHSMLNFRERSPGIFALRIHRMFSKANGPVIDALARYLGGTGDATASRLVDDYIRDHLHTVRGQGSARRVALKPKGTFFDLKRIFDELNGTYFSCAVRAGITWSRNRRCRTMQSTIRLGTYAGYPDGAIIRVHPVLDNSDVPECVVERIVFHEMLHQVFGVSRGKIHSREFQKAERRYRHYRKALNWEKKNLDWLLGRHQFAFHIPAE